MSKKIITISREFGSGGRTIGKKLAEKLNMKYYDKEIIEKVAEETGFSPEYIREKGEHASSGNLFSYAFMGRGLDGTSIDDLLYNAQRKIILDLAEQGSCVIVGRCADYILREREDVLNVFIHADKAKRAERIVKLYGETDAKPEKRLDDKDKKRRVNYKYYTDRTWGMAQNYHLTLDSGAFGIDKCVEIITDLASGK